MRLNTYFANIQRDLRLFLVLLAVICLYRLYFMGWMSSFMGADVTAGDLLQANWTGLRLSLKSAGAVTLVSFLFVTLPGLIRPEWSFARLRLAIGTIGSFLLAVLFQARFPYYQEFHMTYGLQVLQGWHDDRQALFMTMVQEYGLPWRLLIAIGLTVICWYILKKILARQTIPVPMFATAVRKGVFILTLVLATAFFAVFCRFGGGVNYATGINWENAGTTKDDFLNECILDDFQAMYRAQASEKKMKAGNISGVHRENIRMYAQQIAGHTDLQSSDLTPYLTRTAPGAKIAKPKHIFIILGETWAQWPLLDKYADLHAMDGLKSLIREDNCYYTPSFMPNGDFTSAAITGVITGLSEVNIRVNYQPRSFKEVYPTSIAPQFQKLGYQVDFWYGGTPVWDNIGKLAVAQGFDHFYGYPDFHAEKTNTWGTKDENLFNALAETLADEPPTVHVIMTTSNHPPYNIDVTAEGFDLEGTKAKVRELIPDETDPDQLALELGHYWYMDKVVTSFVRDTMQKYPDSVFVITGDHAVRSNPGPHPTMFEFQSVPFVLCGQGITKTILPQNAVGGHTGIAPTLIELIALQGFTYESIAAPVGKVPVAFNRSYWLSSRVMGKVDSQDTELLPGIDTADENAERAELDRVLPAMRTLSWWLIEKGASLDAAE